MPHHELHDFTWMGEPLCNPPDWVNGVEYEEVTPLELTTWLVDKFRQSTQRDVVLLLDETQVVRRLFSPREVQEGWSKADAQWDIDKPAHVLSIAMYIFSDNKAVEKCSTCGHRAAIGPGEECVVDGGGRAHGACTNCYYKGRGGSCSHRVHAEAEQQRAKRRETEAERRLPGVQLLLEELPEDELEYWAAMAAKELAVRKLMRQFPALSRSQIEEVQTDEGGLRSKGGLTSSSTRSSRRTAPTSRSRARRGREQGRAIT